MKIKVYVVTNDLRETQEFWIKLTLSREMAYTWAVKYMLRSNWTDPDDKDKRREFKEYLKAKGPEKTIHLFDNGWYVAANISERMLEI